MLLQSGAGGIVVGTSKIQGVQHAFRLGSVAGPVIQATGRSEFEDDLVSGYSYYMSVRTRLPDHTMQTKFQSLAMLKHLFPLFEYRSEATSGHSVLGWVTALWVCVHPISKETAERCCITS
jgi:hypothetical protein